MRLEDRLREAFARNGSTVQPDVDSVLSVIVDATRRRARLRRSVVALSVVLSAIAIAVLVPRGLSFLRGDTVPQSDHVGLVSPAPSQGRDPLVGTWRASRTCVEEHAALERVGLTNLAARFSVRCAGPTTITVYFRDGGLTLDPINHRDGVAGVFPYHVIDSHTFIAGEIAQFGRMALRYRFTVQADTLTVHLERDDYPIPIPGPTQQMANLIEQTIAWSSAPFQRVG
jgi:hypothetical protein